MDFPPVFIYAIRDRHTRNTVFFQSKTDKMQEKD